MAYFLVIKMKKIFRALIIFLLIFLPSFAFAKVKKTKIDNTLNSQYFLQFELDKKTCEKIIGNECFRRDHMRDLPYYHESRIIIFNEKIFAEQFFENREKSTNMLLLKVNDGNYKLIDEKKNLISFTAKNGVVSNLKLLKGDLKKEKKLESKCDLSQVTYGFHQVHEKAQIVEKSAFFRDEYNFDGLKEVVFFIDKSKPEKPLALLRNSNRNFDAIRDLRICKMPEKENYFVKYFSDEDCQKNSDDEIAQECLKYSVCEDYAIIKNCEVTLLKDQII